MMQFWFGFVCGVLTLIGVAVWLEQRTRSKRKVEEIHLSPLASDFLLKIMAETPDKPAKPARKDVH